MYLRGLYGVRANEKRAVGWLRRSALQEHAEAQYALGLLYAEGRGVPRDAEEAYGWLLRASRNGHAGALQIVRRIQSGLDAAQAAREAATPR